MKPNGSYDRVVHIYTYEKQNTKHITSLVEDDWTKSIPTYYNKYNNFKVGNFQITYPFHYVEKHWMDQDKIAQMEIAWQN